MKPMQPTFWSPINARWMSALACVVFGLLMASPGWAGSIRYAGVNLAGAEFGQQNLPGTYSSDYLYPNQTEVDYFRSKGMNIIRLPFRWERLQRTNSAELDATEFNRLHAFVSATTAKGVHVMIEPHNFARYYPNPRSDFQTATDGVLGTTVPYADFADFWSRLAAIYKTNDLVMFNLMNEPANMFTENWVAAANAAIAAIRAAGATNLILVPGNGFTGAWTWYESWYGTPNAQAMLNIVDPGNNYAYDVHQYLDSDGSGTTTNIVNIKIGSSRLAGFTQWLHDNNRKGFLGEFAVANVTIGGIGTGVAAVSNMLSYVETNSDVWLGWAWWAAGPRWGNYMFTLERTGGGADRPAMAVLRNFIPAPTPALEFTNANQIQFVMRPGFIFQPEASPDMSGGSWTNFGPAIMGTNQTATVDLPGDNEASGFFRVRVNRTP